jgi:hypothetical protein
MFRFPCSYSAATVLFAAFLAVGLLAGNADAQTSANFSANYLVPACQDFQATGEGRARRVDTAFIQGICLGIIADLHSVGRLLPGSVGWCGPSDATYGQLVRVVVAYIERRPQRMHEDFRTLALEALRDAWPCR